MDGDRLLDTNLLIAFLDREPAVVERVLTVDDLLAPSVALGALYLGARASHQVSNNLKRIESLIEWVTIVPCDELTADIYGTIKYQLRVNSCMIPDNDIWIAAAARQTGVRLASRDRHFTNVEHLDWEEW